MKMLSLNELQPLWKKPFACFLLWVYMNSGVEKAKSGSIILYHSGYGVCMCVFGVSVLAKGFVLD